MSMPCQIDAPSRRTWALLAAVLAAWVLALVLIDTPVARWSIENSPFKFLISTLAVSDSFGHGVGVALSAISVWVLDPASRKQVPWVLAGAWGAGLAANVVKFTVGRIRPRAWLEQADHHTQGVWDTFVDWMPLGEGGSGLQSFPSAHTATAFGLAVMLSRLYPAGRRWFYVLALLVAVQRVTSHAHFPSDVVAGGLLGWVVAGFVARWMPGVATKKTPAT